MKQAILFGNSCYSPVPNSARVHLGLYVGRPRRLPSKLPSCNEMPSINHSHPQAISYYCVLLRAPGFLRCCFHSSANGRLVQSFKMYKRVSYTREWQNQSAKPLLRYATAKRPVRFLIYVAVFVTIVVCLRRESGETNVEFDVENVKFKNIVIRNWTSEVGNNRRIFFHETSGRGYLSFRQCCAVESVAKNNPTRPVQLFLSAGSIDREKFKGCLATLDYYPNVEIYLVDNEKYFKNTPLEEW